MRDVTISEFNKMLLTQQLGLLKFLDIELIKTDGRRLFVKKTKKVTTSINVSH